MTSTDVVADHRAAGRAFTAAGLTGFVREAGDGETVLCMHGVPTSSFLYRKVLDELAARNVRCVAFDLPGLGLADRPENFDYTWTGLGQYSVAAIDALELQSFHLVVHDVGGPVGFELAAAVPDRVKSLTVLNTIVDVDTFKRPWSMEPFARRGVGEVYLRALSKPAFRMLMGLQGVADRSAVPNAELHAHVDLLKARGRWSSVSEDHARLRAHGRQARPLPLRARRRPLPGAGRLGREGPGAESRHPRRGSPARRGVATIPRLPGKHFLQEDQAPAIADLVAGFTRD